jgi:bifunctional non-homologous end joining protein LigD
MVLEKYNQKRKFKETPEPEGKKGAKGKFLKFIVQKHDASHLHYDLRLEMGGVMKSWAVPKGPSLNPQIKRLAMQVEDHPLSYNKFEGTIPEGNYGAGEVIVWDKGTYHSLKTKNTKESEEEFLEGLKKGRLKFILNGKKLKGKFSLFRFKSEKEWILAKSEDEFATLEEITSDPRSVLSKKILIGKNEDTEKYKKLIKKHTNV